MNLATAVIVNAVCDLWAEAEDNPVWKLLCGMTRTTRSTFAISRTKHPLPRFRHPRQKLIRPRPQRHCSLE